MESVIQTMINCIAYEVCGQNEKIVLPEVSARFLSEVYKLSKAHDMAHLVGDALNKSGVFENLPDDMDEKERAAIEKVKEKFDEQIFTAVYRYENINYELERLKETLEEAKIPFIPLKGAVIRKYYPEPWMRTSCDIDILIKNADTDIAIGILCKAGYIRTEDSSTHDYNLVSSNGIHIELHFTLTQGEDFCAANELVKTIWNEAILDEGECCYSLIPETIVFYHLLHMARHILHGGCGVRPFIDLWLLNKKMIYDQQKLEIMLINGGLFALDKAALCLCKVWLENGEHNSNTRALEKYIINGGVYGTAENSARVQAAKKVGKLKLFFNIMFLKKETLAVIYPKLKKHPLLLPWYQIKRWFRIFNKDKRDKVKTLIKRRNEVQLNNKKDTEDMLKSLDLLNTNNNFSFR